MDLLMEVESDVNIGKRRSHSSTSTTRMSGQYILDKWVG
jgi:hypothetical protein